MYIYFILTSTLSALGFNGAGPGAPLPSAPLRPAAVATDLGGYEVRTIPGLNGEKDDYAAVIAKDEAALYFSSDRSPVFHHDIYSISIEGSLRTEFSVAQPYRLPGPVNSMFSEGTLTFFPDGKQMMFSGCDRTGGIGNCDLILSGFVSGEWRTAEKDPDLNRVICWNSHPSLSGSGDTLFFLSDRPGALGGPGDADIYVSFREFGIWSLPRNIGPQVNTEFLEDAPFFMPGTSTLYFASKGYEGFGGFDLYRTTLRQDGSWTPPENLGEPFNTVEDDRFIHGLSDGSLFFVTSRRSNPENRGGLDIYAIVPITGRVSWPGKGLQSRMQIWIDRAGSSVTLQPVEGKGAITGMVRIFAADGTMAAQVEPYTTSEEIDISTLSPGFYLIVLDAGEKGRMESTFVQRG